jgi:hypothetical protein
MRILIKLYPLFQKTKPYLPFSIYLQPFFNKLYQKISFYRLRGKNGAKKREKLAFLINGNIFLELTYF